MIADRVKVQIDILIPFQKKSPADLNSKFLGKVKIQNLIPQTELSFRILSRESSLKTDLPRQRAFLNSIPPRGKFQYLQRSLKKSEDPIPSGAKTSNYQSPAEPN